MSASRNKASRRMACGGCDFRCRRRALCLAGGCPVADRAAGDPGPSGAAPRHHHDAAAVAIGGRLYAPSGGSKQGKSMTRLANTIRRRIAARARPLPQPLYHLGGGRRAASSTPSAALPRPSDQGSADVALEYDPRRTRGGGSTDAGDRAAPPARRGERQIRKSPRPPPSFHRCPLRTTSSCDAIEVYDPAKTPRPGVGGWGGGGCEAAPLPLARDHLAVVAAEGKIHVSAGAPHPRRPHRPSHI